MRALGKKIYIINLLFVFPPLSLSLCPIRRSENRTRDFAFALHFANANKLHTPSFHIWVYFGVQICIEIFVSGALCCCFATNNNNLDEKKEERMCISQNVLFAYSFWHFFPSTYVPVHVWVFFHIYLNFGKIRESHERERETTNRKKQIPHRKSLIIVWKQLRFGPCSAKRWTGGRQS